jgi:hypothetical protein
MGRRSTQNERNGDGDSKGSVAEAGAAGDLDRHDEERSESICRNYDLCG